MTTNQRTQTADKDGAAEGDEEKPLPRYLVDFEVADALSRSLPVVIAGRRCRACQQADEEAPSASSDAAKYMKRIVGHCTETSDYLPPDTPLKEAIFRVLLSRGNEPVHAEEISQVLSEKWAMTPYPRDVSNRVIQRLLEHSETYCIARVPEPEPEPEPEELPHAEIAQDEALATEEAVSEPPEGAVEEAAPDTK